MQVTIDWIHLAELAGAVQGLLLAVALAAHRTNRTANRLLAALMAAFTVSLLSEVYYAAGLVRSAPHFFGISYPLPWTFGPLVYLYAVAASDRRWRFGARGALHLAPAVGVVLLTLPIYLKSGPEKIALFDRMTAGDVPTVLRLLDPTKYVSGIAYSAATVMYLRAHRRRVQDSYSNTERVNLRWLQSLAAVAAAIWLLAVVSANAGLVPPSIERSSDNLVSLAVAAFVYAIGYKGLRQPEVFRYDRPEPAPAPVPDAPPDAPPVPPTEPAASVAQPADRTDARYERSGLGEFETRRLKAALLSLMDTEHPYRDPELTLPALAERLKSTPHKLSEVLNREISQTFYDFVNAYRVDEVRARLADPATKHLNILALGLDAGFASKSTFNQAFKKLTGQTPSAYRKVLEARPSLRSG
ncbi:Helix-turn-helix, AraC domain-containing protein [Gemmatirosa kalamazoonensis]|uniref:Helix-turn-helix, AraC domain-containing protein n=1 Tax=Gemmatirosa kalamazoonensis TaxID=861299 RepID=W0RCP3_9BACT|nr:helix-turn-helix domain-containing protein [Gemmatirosa kalamazoonensis]AHG88879.1 Helix-turn-helix, AraC domain-containing protein [Gemmatirosa kalamazoonensis]